MARTTKKNPHKDTPKRDAKTKSPAEARKKKARRGLSRSLPVGG